MALLKRHPALFFDRDGVLNVNHGYVHRPDQLEWIPGAREAVLRANQAALKTVVVTNQAGIARGFYDIPTFHALMDRMREELAQIGAHLDGVYFCPYHPEGVNEYRGESEFRKPRPGMILQAMEELHLDSAQCLLVGDFESDIEAARNAGIEGHRFPGGNLLEFMESRDMFRFGR